MNDKTANAYEAYIPADGISAVPPLLAYWYAAKRWKWLIAAMIAAFLIAALIWTVLATPFYSATTRVEISRQAEQVTDVKAVEQIDTGKDDEFYETQYALLRARSLAERVVRQLNLVSDENFFALYGYDLEDPSGAPSSAERSERLRLATDILLDHVVILPIRDSSLIDVEFSSPDPQLAAKIANAWVEQFIASTLERRFASTNEARKFLEERLQELRGRMEQSERNLVNYAASRGIVTLAEETGPTGRRVAARTIASANLEALNTALASATEARIRAESALRAGPGLEAQASNTALAGLRQQRAEVASELAQLRARFEAGYPQVQAMESRLNSLNRAIASEEGRSSTGLGNDYQEALSREQMLEARVNALKSARLREQGDSIQYNMYQREVDTNRELYDGLLQRFKEIGVAGVASNNVAIVDRAEIPRSPSSPNLLLNLVLALLLGVLCAMLLVVALEQIDQKVKDPADVRQRLGLPLLGIIPYVEDAAVVDSVADPKSALSEAYLSLQTNLSFLTDHGVPKSILFTSTEPNEGKSNSAYALGHTLGRTGKRVVLVDADMRNSSIHLLGGVPNRAGLSNWLTGETSLESLLQPSGQANFTIMPAGPTPPNAGELLISPRLGELIAELTRRFDVVLVDGPPVLGLADVPLIAGVTEGVVYAVQSGGPRLRSIQHALSRLRAAQAHIFGVLVTKMDTTEGGYGYNYGYGYGRDRDLNDTAAAA